MTKKETKKSIVTKKASPVVPAGRPGIPNPVDIHCGHRLRERRTLLGLNQTRLAETLGITFQQIQKYERGANRISASRLVDLSSVLDVEIMYFFENMPNSVLKQSPRLRSGLGGNPLQDITDNPLMKRAILELVRVYYQIKDPRQRKNIINLCRSMVAKSNKT